MSRTSGAPLSINRASASHTAPPRGSPGAASRTTSACAARVPAMPFPVERRRDRHDEIIDPGQGIDHGCEFAKIQLAVAANR